MARTVFIAGGNEFLPDEEVRREGGSLKPLATAYDRLGYDLGVFTPQEKEWLSSGETSPPAEWLMFGLEPQSRVIEKNGRRIGVVLFPSALPVNSPDEKSTRLEVRAKALELRGNADVIIGVCPWGLEAEEEFLSEGPPVFDILFGAGAGRGIQTKLFAEDATLLVHPYPKGEVILTVEIKEMPVRSKGWSWTLGGNIRSDMVVLRDNVPTDMDMYSLLHQQ